MKWGKEKKDGKKQLNHRCSYPPYSLCCVCCVCLFAIFYIAILIPLVSPSLCCSFYKMLCRYTALSTFITQPTEPKWIVLRDHPLSAPPGWNWQFPLHLASRIPPFLVAAPSASRGGSKCIYLFIFVFNFQIYRTIRSWLFISLSPSTVNALFYKVKRLFYMIGL